ncbi:MAG: hypothetical protein RL751_910, partial [Bacteroidota bacterium]
PRKASAVRQLRQPTVQQDPTLVNFLKAQFWPIQKELHASALLYKEALRILIQYAQIHLSGFDLDKTMEILHDTLYD